MTAPAKISVPALDAYELQDRYARRSGRVFLTGTQALVRITVDQARRDREAGLNTAGLVSGYRGSPLGGLDLELWRANGLLDEARVEFLPAVNEDMAATAIFGTQQVETDPNREVDGVFGIWYGKGPGVDRTGDAFKHANAYGSSPTGGVLVVAGDDHGCVSSSMPHQSDAAFLSWFMPVLNPASVAEYQAFGEYGFALSRYSGMWVGFKAVAETVESAASVELVPDRVINDPDYEIPPSGLHLRWPDLPGVHIEERLEAKKHAVFAFAEANPIDQRIYDIPDATYGIVTTGKGHHDLMEALRLLGLGEAECRRLGIDIYKVGMVWPLARRAALEFVRGKQEILVVEEKRGIIESQFKEYFYDYPGDKPTRMVGKNDETGTRLVPWTGELSPGLLVPIVAKRLDALLPGLNLSERAAALAPAPERIIEVPGAQRTSWFCSGCPHNTSTKVPEGSRALAGIGCHVMASWMDRETSSITQMGGEGVNWVGSSRFTGNGHIFQNLGDGTYYHSGSMAIRQAIAAGTNITYKILFNGAVAMTGGQPLDGPVSVQAIANEVRAEGVERIALLSDDIGKFSAGNFPRGVSFHDRSELDQVQRELREVKGVSVLIYEQACATEKRRRRKRGTMPDPDRFAFINDLVCEGCGDCSTESNCLSVEPLETPFGRKRRINQSTCNKDFSCLNGFCPSFVTVEGAKRRRRQGAGIDAVARAAAIDLPTMPGLSEPFDLVVTGVGGTGVVTVGQLVTMAAHLEGKQASVLDFTGFSQKFGPVMSYVRLAAEDTALNQVRVDQGAADALIGCDALVSASPKASASYGPAMKAAVNSAGMPTGDVVRFPDASLGVPARLTAMERVVGADRLSVLDANRSSERLLGDTVFSNVLMLGFAWQLGLVPVSFEAMDRAIELNGVAVEKNRQAFAWGRLAVAEPEFLKTALGDGPAPEESLDEMIERRMRFLAGYQNDAWAERYAGTVARVREAEAGHGSEALSKAVVRSLFKLMAYKDEYEVARLLTDKSFSKKIGGAFEGDYRIVHHLAPPFLPGREDARGRPVKRRFGSWIRTPLRLLAAFKGLRGTVFDPFGRTAERRMERGLIGWYEGVVKTLLDRLDRIAPEEAAEIAGLAMKIRGYGPVKEQAVGHIRAEVDERLAKAVSDEMRQAA